MKEIYATLTTQEMPKTPEATLMFEVLEFGVEDFLYPEEIIPSNERAHIHNNAANWINKTDWNYPLSFCNLCAVFGLDPEATRQKLRKIKNETQRSTRGQHRFNMRQLLR